MEKNIFPAGNALGQGLIIDDNSNCKVTAVYDDIPANSHFHFDILRAINGRTRRSRLR